MATETQIPQKMKAVFLEKCISDLKASAEELHKHFKVRDVEVPHPKSGEVLIKVARSPINPSDLMCLKTSDRSLPWIPGLEGSGTVVANGGGTQGENLLGKRVGFFTRGSGGVWAEYVVVPASSCIPLPDKLDFNAAASAYVNPLTALGLLDVAKSEGHTAIVHSAAASALGKMLLRICKAENIKVIGIVRREEQVDELLKLGATAVFVTGKDERWIEDFKSKVNELNARLFFDAVGGEFTGKVLHAMPTGSSVRVYGLLSEQPCVIHGSDLIMGEKCVGGFLLPKWIEKKSEKEREALFKKVSELIESDFKTKVREVVDFGRVGEGVAKYVSDMSAGKVLVTPSLER